MLYSQIILNNGISSDLNLPGRKPVAAGNLTREELDTELSKGAASLKEGADFSGW